MQRARLNGTLFPDNSNKNVHLLFFLNHLVDLSRCGGFSWGSAVLACLYRNLCKATNPRIGNIAGPFYLLQLWVWERFKGFAPRIKSKYMFDQPLGARYGLHNFWTNNFYYLSNLYYLDAGKFELQRHHITCTESIPFSAPMLTRGPGFKIFSPENSDF
jgi:hypothetical protein